MTICKSLGVRMLMLIRYWACSDERCIHVRQLKQAELPVNNYFARMYSRVITMQRKFFKGLQTRIWTGVKNVLVKYSNGSISIWSIDCGSPIFRPYEHVYSPKGNNKKNYIRATIKADYFWNMNKKLKNYSFSLVFMMHLIPLFWHAIWWTWNSGGENSGQPIIPHIGLY